MAGPEASGDFLTDGDLQFEIELVGELVVAATSSDGPLPQEEIDRLLGVVPSGAGAAPAAAPPAASSASD